MDVATVSETPPEAVLKCQKLWKEILGFKTQIAMLQLQVEELKKEVSKNVSIEILSKTTNLFIVFSSKYFYSPLFWTFLVMVVIYLVFNKSSPVETQLSQRIVTCG